MIDAYRVTFVLGAFGGDRNSAARKILRHKVLYECLDALTRIDLHEILAAQGRIPKIYQSGARYQAEPEGQEDWLDVLSCLQMIETGEWKTKGLDCEEIASWRAAELQAEGVAAHPVFVWRKMPNGSHLYHIVVRYPDGRIEDPCRKLGMK